MKVRFTLPALANLEAIYDYVSQYNPDAANHVKVRIKERAESLGDFPRSGKETDLPMVRVFVVGRYPYLIFYKAEDDEVQILHVRHGARRPFTGER